MVKVASGGEQELILRCLEGDDVAWTALFRLHAGFVRGIARWTDWGLGEEEAEDVVQETFVRLLSNLPRFRMESSLKTYLTRITRAVCIDRRRRLAARGGETISLDAQDDGFDAPLVERLAASSSDAFSTAARRDEVRRAEEALRPLSKSDRVLLKARFVEGLENKEIARILGIRENACAVRVHRATARARKNFERLSRSAV